MLNIFFISIAYMMTKNLKNNEAQNLTELFAPVKNVSKFIKLHNLKVSASLIAQHKSGHRPISLHAAKEYAKAFQVPISSISPHIAKELKGVVITPEGEFEVMDTSKPTPIVESGSTPSAKLIRLEHLSAQPSMGYGNEINDENYIVQYLDVSEEWVRREIGTTDPKRIKVVTGIGRSMRPTINDKDLVFIDTACTAIDYPDIYVLSIGTRLLLKRAIILAGQEMLVLRSDNTTEFPDEERIPLKDAEQIRVAGRVKAWWTLVK